MSNQRNNLARRVFVTPASYQAQTISNETVSIPAGAAGTIVNAYISKKPITDSNGCYIGGYGNSSLTLTSTAFTTEVAKKSDSELSNGQFWVDYITGKIRGKKATTATSATATYKIFKH